MVIYTEQDMHVVATHMKVLLGAGMMYEDVLRSGMALALSLMTEQFDGEKQSNVILVAGTLLSAASAHIEPVVRALFDLQQARGSINDKRRTEISD